MAPVRSVVMMALADSLMMSWNEAFASDSAGDT
jgi:hypothetical protein